jgi:hypothetical protein
MQCQAVGDLTVSCRGSSGVTASGRAAVPMQRMPTPRIEVEE